MAAISILDLIDEKRKKTLQSYREEIDLIDSEILDLLSKRKEIVLRISNIKKKTGKKVRDLKREKLLFQKIEQLSKQLGIDKKVTKDLFKLIVKDSVCQQKK